MTPDELELINGLAETDKKAAPAADAGDVESVESDKDDDTPVAEGVDRDRAERWAVYDLAELRYVSGTVRTRKPTRKMLEAYAGDRYEVRRV